MLSFVKPSLFAKGREWAIMLGFETGVGDTLE
jgi:hypothetical protein